MRALRHLGRRLETPIVHRGLAAAIAVMVMAQAAVLATHEADAITADAVVTAATDITAAASGPVSVDTSAGTPVGPHDRRTAAVTDHVRWLSSLTSAERRFWERHPAQVAATEDPADPATTRWAVLIGINKHSTSVRDNFGSRQDAEDLYEHLLSLGWRDDHIVLLTDTAATREAMLQAMAWLDEKTTPDSVAVFHYSGHSKKWYGQDHDGDGEITDEGLWPADGQFIPDSEMVDALDGVEGQLWVNIGACESAGFNDPGLDREGRLLTFSSREDQKSYEDPSVENSVWGYYLVDQALLDGRADANGDGEVTVEEAVLWAAPAAHERTQGQRYGTQDAVMIDRVDGDFSLSIPDPPPAEQEQDDPGQGGGNNLCLGPVCVSER